MAFFYGRAQVMDDEELKVTTEEGHNQNGSELTKHFPVSDESVKLNLNS